MDSKRKILTAAVAVAASAAAYFYGTGLHPHWYLTWVAPVPILFLALRSSWRSAGAAAFLAFTLGGLNMWSYYLTVSALPIALIVVLFSSLVFAAVILAFRAFAMRRQLIRATLAVPVIWVAVEYLSEFRSPHSTFGNIAYTQMDCLPVLQVVAVTGIWSIAFLLFLFPAAIAAMTAPIEAVREKRIIALGTAAVFAVTLGYGAYRLRSGPVGPRITTGLIASDVRQTVFAQGAGSVELVRRYAEHIPELAQEGAQVIVIPEKIGRFGPQEIQQADEILESAAKANHVTIAAGFLQLPNLNELRLYSPGGTLEATYEKHHMLPAFESSLLPGTARVVVERPSGKWGLAICKDMDFPLLSRQYSEGGAGLLLVPAWDFVADGWLHGRMAILRGVESGFSIARAPKQGILTLTDDRGRILAERDSGSAPFATVVASIPVKNEPTFYARTGNWFAWADLALLVVLYVWPMREPRRVDIRP